MSAAPEATADRYEDLVRQIAHSLPPMDLGSTKAIKIVAALLRGQAAQHDRRAKRLADLLQAAERLANEAQAACCWFDDPDNYDDSRLDQAVRDYRSALVFWRAETVDG